MSNIYSNKIIFLSIIIFLILFIYCRVLNFYNFLLFLILFFIIYYLSNYYVKSTDFVSHKKEYIIPNINNDNKDIIDFVFSIQDLYKYNPNAYQECIDNLNSFFEIYELTMKKIENKGKYYDLAKTYMRNSVNSLQSIIFNLDANNNLVDKLNRSHLRLQTLLNKYLNDIYHKCKEQIFFNGLDNSIKIPEKGELGYNIYDNFDDYTGKYNKDFTYQFI